MILEPCSFKQADAGFKGKGYIAIDIAVIDVAAGYRAIGNCIIEIFQDLSHHIFAGVSSLVHKGSVIRLDNMLIERNISEHLDLVPIEPGSPHAAYTFIVVADGFAYRLSGIFDMIDEIIDLIQVGPVSYGPVGSLPGRISSNL